jgi:hypothetical protein
VPCGKHLVTQYGTSYDGYEEGRVLSPTFVLVLRCSHASQGRDDSAG